MQRAEDTTRVVLAQQLLVNRLGDNAMPLLQELPPVFDNTPPVGAKDLKAYIRYMLTDRDNPFSVVSELELVNMDVRSVRGLVPEDAWMRVRGLQDSCIKLASAGKTNIQELLEEYIRGSLALAGVISTGMLRSEGYLFWQVGRQLAGAEMTCGIVHAALRCQANEPEESFTDSMLWVQLLKALGMLDAYRMCTHEPIEALSAARFALGETRTSHAVSACLAKATTAAAVLPGNAKLIKALAACSQALRAFRIGGAGTRAIEAETILQRLDNRIDMAMATVGKVYFPSQ